MGFLRSSGRSFQIFGPATENDLSAKVTLLVRGTHRSLVSLLERSPCLLVFSLSKDDKYSGASPFKLLCTKQAILKTILRLTGSQCSCLRHAVALSRQLFLKINLAQMFW